MPIESRKIRPLILRDMTSISQRAENCPPGIIVFELVKNGIEAGGNVDVLEGRGNSTIVVDSGHGMSRQDLSDFIAEYGAGKKRRGGAGNMGVGAKAFVMTHSPQGVEWISKVEGSNQCYRLELAANEFGLVGPVEDAKGEIVTPCDTPRELRGKKSGTVVCVRGLQFDAAVIAKYLNAHLIAPARTVQVWQSWGSSQKPITICGPIECLKQIAMPDKFGVVDGPLGTYYWAVKRPAEELEGTHLAKYAFDINTSVIKAWNGQSYRVWLAQHGGGRMLARVGVTAGASRVVVIKIAKDKPGASKKEQIVPNDIRSDFENWAEDDADEFFEDNFPDELDLWLEKFKKDHWEDQPERELVAELLNLVLGGRGAGPGKGAIKPGRPKSEPPKPAGKGGGGGGGSGGSRTTTRSRSYEYQYCDSGEMPEGKAIELRGNIVFVNKDHIIIRELLDPAKGNLTEEKVLRGLAASECLTALTIYWENFREEPTQEALNMAVCSTFATRLRAFDRTIMPLKDISVADEKERKKRKRRQ